MTPIVFMKPATTPALFPAIAVAVVQKEDSARYSEPRLTESASTAETLLGASAAANSSVPRQHIVSHEWRRLQLSRADSTPTPLGKSELTNFHKVDV